MANLHRNSHASVSQENHSTLERRGDQLHCKSTGIKRQTRLLYLYTRDMLNHKFLFAMETSDLFGVLLWIRCSCKSNLGVGNRSISIDA